MKLLPYYCLILTFFTGLNCQPASPSPKLRSQPNIVLIFADDLGYGDLGCYGHPNIKTPRLDQMAHEGIKMTGLYVAAPVCTPSRAGILTGRYPIRFGLPGNVGPDSPNGIPADEITLAEALKDVGYKTAAFGKWHLGARSGFFPTDHGFDEYFGILYSNDMEPPYIQTDRPLHLYRDTTATDEYPVEQTTLTERYTAEAIRFIRQNKNQPFFLYLPHAMPHLPVSTSAKFAGKSAGARYGDVIETLDWSTGHILDALKEEGLDENTLVIFTSDNGPWNNLPPRMYNAEKVEKWDSGSSGPFRGAKATTWEGGLRVPCIMRWPGKIPATQVSNEQVSSLDLYPTLLNIAGAKLARDRTYDGKDIWPVITQQASSPHQYYYYFWIDRLQGVRDQEWKLILRQEPEDPALKPRLFNLRQDPSEIFDLAEQHPEVVEQLWSELKRFGAETKAIIPDWAP